MRRWNREIDERAATARPEPIVRASHVAPASDKTDDEKRKEAARKAVSARRGPVPPSVRKAQVNEVVKARFADKGIGGKR